MMKRDDSFIACVLCIMLTAFLSSVVNQCVNAATTEYWRLYVIGASAAQNAKK